MARPGDAVLLDLATLAEHVRAPTGRRLPYVVGSGDPVGALGDFYASVLNQNVTAWRSAPAAVAIERTVLGWLAEAIGCSGFAGSFTSGGSLGNLKALAMAREAHAPANEEGAQPGVVYASEEVHMSIPKAVGMLGLGRANLRLVGVDENMRIDVPALETAETPDPAPFLGNPHKSTPSSVHGKEGIDGSSPSEGFHKSSVTAGLSPRRSIALLPGRSGLEHETRTIRLLSGACRRRASGRH
jgi:Pyridoxal-dependent decarboxylase conserved domain